MANIRKSGTEPASELIRRAKKFVDDFKDAKKENSESQTFWNEFFKIFGLNRRDVAKFEENVKKVDGRGGGGRGRQERASPRRIDVFWPKVLLVEQKSAGKDLDKADEQAMEYYKNLNHLLRPKFVISSDFVTFRLQNIDSGNKWEFTLNELPENLSLFGFMIGREDFEFEEHVSIEAANLIKKIHDLIWKSRHPEEAAYKQHILNMHIKAVKKAKAENKKPPKMPSVMIHKTPEQMEVYRRDKNKIGRFLTRISYCLFAEDSGIFEPKQFIDYVKRKTETDPTQLGGVLQKLFSTLNEERRNEFIDKDLDAFPYIDGKLFQQIGDETQIDCNEDIRQALIDAASFDWSFVSPSVFGSMFESVMDVDERRESGSHYTTTENVHKVINPLFMDDLWNTYYKIVGSKLSDSIIENKLKIFQRTLANLKFLDPACGSGSFLITSYHEIRRLEFEIINKIYKNKALSDSTVLSIIDVNQFYGIELNPFPAKITETAMWMVDHLENQRLFDVFDGAEIRIPLKKHPNIVVDDALEINWDAVLPKNECDYIIGNPPFAGTRTMTKYQKIQTKKISGIKNVDYVSNWFIKASHYMSETCRAGLVTTNSLFQGEQIMRMWPLFEKKNIDLIYAYDSFKWTSDTKNTAGVTVMIIGFSKDQISKKKLFDINGKESNPNYISPYMCGFNKKMPIVTTARGKINGLPDIRNGVQLVAGNHYDMSKEEKDEFIKNEPNAEKYISKYINADQMLSGTHSYVITPQNIEPNELVNLPLISERIKSVKKFRKNSKSDIIRKHADTPTEYYTNLNAETDYLAIPGTSSENREYIPMQFMDKSIIPSNAIMVILNAKIELQGLLQSKMHMAWLKLLVGRLETRIRYSGIAYNTFPLPNNMEKLIPFTNKIIVTIKNHPNSTLAQLYDSVLMPADLKNAHIELDAAVDKLYRKEPFTSEHERWEFLLGMYEKMISGNQQKLTKQMKITKSKKSKVIKKSRAKKDSKKSNDGIISKKKTKKPRNIAELDSIDSYISN